MEKSGSGGGGVRLHVGGLGESVGRDDLLKIFSPMGSVDAVEFVRTKGRSFAYIDFSPSSSNSLTKLFSTYNGCVWKGGKLRLEKAKEHYLARLKREWEEEASSASVDTIKAPTDSTPSTQINIFFPRLRKVKAMPLSGTGKHKYSFQRIPVTSSLPKSFCDCEEHSNSLTPRETHVQDLEALNVGVNEDEVNVMNSVINKLFEKNNIPINEEVPEEDSEIEADQDNLVINVVSNGNDMENSVLDMLSRKRKSTLRETTASEGQKGKHIHPSKKMKSIIPEGSGRQESSQAIREKKKPSEVVPDEPSRTAAVKQSVDNVSWSQKSSWKALMANGNSSGFSVSSVLPGVGSSKAVPPASRNTALTGLPIQEKSKKTKSKRVTSTIMAEDLPVSDDDMERDDSDDVAEDDLESDDSDVVAGDDMERDDEGDDSDAVADDDIERDDSDAESDDDLESDHSDAVADDDMERDDEGADSDAVADDDIERDDSDAVSDDDAAEDGTASDSMADHTSSDSVDDDTASEAVGSDHLETFADTVTDTSVEAEPLEGNRGNGKLNVEKHENVAEDSNEEKESLVLKDNVVDEEMAGKEPLKASNKSAGGSSWLQKASWTQLVSDNNTSSFSITQLFPDLDSDKGKAAKVINNEDGQYSNSNQSASGTKQTDYACSSGGFVSVGVPVVSTPVRSVEVNKHSLNGKNLSEGGRLGARKIIRRNIGSGETCTFMRSSASLKEWAKAKKELNEPRRRKKSEE